MGVTVRQRVSQMEPSGIYHLDAQLQKNENMWKRVWKYIFWSRTTFMSASRIENVSLSTFFVCASVCMTTCVLVSVETTILRLRA